MEILFIFFLILINGFYALSEVAFITSDREVIEQAKARGNRLADRVLRYMNDPERFLSGIQVGITLIGIISGVFSGITIAEHLQALLEKIPLLKESAYILSLVLTIGTVTYVSILIGELVPKAIALRNPEKILLRITPIVNLFIMLTFPLVALLSFSTKFILKLTGMYKPVREGETDYIKEMLNVSTMALLKNKIDGKQADIISNTIKLRETPVSGLMVKPEEIKTLKESMSLNEALLESHIHHHTRYPLIDGTGAYLGYVNFKDIINAIRINPANPSLKSICRPLLSVRENEKAIEILQKLIAQHQHIALVRDIKGTPSGLLSIENILELIVGNIGDEYDLLPDYLYNITEDRWLAGGGINMAALKETFPELPGLREKLSSWLVTLCGQKLKTESVVRFGTLVFHVRKVTRSRIWEAIIERSSPEKAERDECVPTP